MNGTVASMLEITQGNLALEEESREDPPPPCESKWHPTAKYGHQPDKHAEFWVILPCGADRLMCRGWVEKLYAYNTLLCLCDKIHPVAEVTTIPLDGREGI